MKKYIFKLVILIFISILSFSVLSFFKTSLVFGATTKVRITKQCNDSACTLGCYDISRVVDSGCTEGCNATTHVKVTCETQTCAQSISPCGSGGCASNQKRVCYPGDVCSKGCSCESFSECTVSGGGGVGDGGGTTNPTATPVPTATTAPGAPTPTGTPATRLAATEGTEDLCKSLTVSATTLTASGSVTLTSSAKDGTDVKTFTYKFFNAENSKTNKAIMFTANTPFEIPYTSSNLSSTNSTIVNFSDMDKPDLNWDYFANRPKKVVVEAYFTKPDAKWSKFNAACRTEFTVNSIDPTPTISQNCKCTNNACTSDCLVDKYDGITYTTPLKCGVDATIYTTTGVTTLWQSQNSWCGYYKRAKGDANGDGKVDSLDYFYYASAKAGAKLPLSVIVDFNGDGYIGNDDRAIIVKSVK